MTVMVIRQIGVLLVLVIRGRGAPDRVPVLIPILHRSSYDLKPIAALEPGVGSSLGRRWHEDEPCRKPRRTAETRCLLGIGKLLTLALLLHLPSQIIEPVLQTHGLSPRALVACQGRELLVTGWTTGCRRGSRRTRVRRDIALGGDSSPLVVVRHLDWFLRYLCLRRTGFVLYERIGYSQSLKKE
jgi:hypothetical protein